MYRLTEKGRKKADYFIRECKAKQKEIIDAGLDTADYTFLPTIADIETDIEMIGVDDDGEYWNAWGVTDHYNSDYPLSLIQGRDFNPAPADNAAPAV